MGVRRLGKKTRWTEESWELSLERCSHTEPVKDQAGVRFAFTEQGVVGVLHLGCPDELGDEDRVGNGSWLEGESAIHTRVSKACVNLPC